MREVQGPKAWPLGILNLDGEHWIKTSGATHAIVWAATLCVIEALGPGRVEIVDTDWQDELWISAADWAAEVFKRPMPTPSGLLGSGARRAAVKAWIESQELSAAVKPGPARKPRRM